MSTKHKYILQNTSHCSYECSGGKIYKQKVHVSLHCPAMVSHHSRPASSTFTTIHSHSVIKNVTFIFRKKNKDYKFQLKSAGSTRPNYMDIKKKGHFTAVFNV